MSDDPRKQLDDFIEHLPPDDPRRNVEIGDRRFDKDVAAIWAESTEHGVIVHAQANGMRLTFGMTREQARNVSQLISRAAGGDA